MKLINNMVTIDVESSKYINTAFKFADLKNKGYLNSNEYKSAVIALFGKKPFKGEKDAIFGCDRSRKLTMKEFTDLMQNKMKQSEREQHIHEAFLLIDSDSKGFLVLEDLRKAQKNAFPHLNTRVIEKAFAVGGINEDGRISYREFHNMMSYGLKNFI